MLPAAGQKGTGWLRPSSNSNRTRVRKKGEGCLNGKDISRQLSWMKHVGTNEAKYLADKGCLPAGATPDDKGYELLGKVIEEHKDRVLAALQKYGGKVRETRDAVALDKAVFNLIIDDLCDDGAIRRDNKNNFRIIE